MVYATVRRRTVIAEARVGISARCVARVMVMNLSSGIRYGSWRRFIEGSSLSPGTLGDLLPFPFTRDFLTPASPRTRLSTAEGAEDLRSLELLLRPSILESISVSGKEWLIYGCGMYLYFGCVVVELRLQNNRLR
jgi:hypothetical protein